MGCILWSEKLEKGPAEVMTNAHDIAAPTFVVCDDSFNHKSNSGTVFHESLIKRDGHFNWTKYVYFWIPFEWTCRDDSVQMNEFDKPPVATVEARENYFNVAVTEGMLITMEQTHENEIDAINEDDDDCSVAMSDYELLQDHF
jgi:hypothetical protein